MPLRICVDCARQGLPPLFDATTAPGQRCPTHQATATRRQQARPNTTQRGLGHHHRQQAAADPNYTQATHCQCPGCPQHTGICGKPFTPANPKTIGHATPRSKGGTSGPIRPECRACNSARGAR